MIDINPFLLFLAAQTGTEASPAWEKGPTTWMYRSRQDVPITEYIQRVQELEASPNLAGQSAAQLAQRLRRMHYSAVTEKQRPGASDNMDTLISNTTYTTFFSSTPPLTTDQVTQDLLDFFWSCNTVKTKRGHTLDISHVWVIVDLMLAGRSTAGVLSEGPYFDTDDLRPVLSWAGDFANAINEYSIEAGKQPRNSISKPDRIALFEQGILKKAGKDDIIADIDAINLGNIAESLGNRLVLSEMLDRYYKDDDMPQAQAKALLMPTSARRFHYFISFATPTIPANGASRLSSVALEVTLKRAEAIELFKTFFIDMADDLLDSVVYSASDMVDFAGRDLYDQFCEKVADFLVEGLRTGDVNWPPTRWS